VRRTASLIVVSLLLGCGGTSAYREAAHDRGQASLDCAHVRTVEIGGGGYEVRGCGRYQSFTCATTARPWSFGSRATCIPDGPPQTIASRATAPVAPRTPESSIATEDARVALAAIATCPSVEREATITFTIGSDGQVQRTETPGVPVTTGTCIVTALRGAQFATRDRSEIARLRLDPHGTSPTAPAATAPSQADVAARARIESLRDLLLACTDGQPVAVVADWTAEGALTLHLGASHAGTPEDGCVRATASGEALTPAPGVPGSVLHPVH
jgi:hypothetical protein